MSSTLHFSSSFALEIVSFYGTINVRRKNLWENLEIKGGFCSWKVFFYDWNILIMFSLFVHTDFLMNLFF